MLDTVLQFFSEKLGNTPEYIPKRQTTGYQIVQAHAYVKTTNQNRASPVTSLIIGYQMCRQAILDIIHRAIIGKNCAAIYLKAFQL